MRGFGDELMTPLPTIVAIGCSTVADYSYLAPLTALFWQDAIGHEPRLYLVGQEEEWASTPQTATVLRALSHHRILHGFIARVGNYGVATLAQNVRQHAAAHTSIDDHQWIMPGDADLWPLRRAYYHQHEDFGGLAVCYNANGDHFESREVVLDRAARGLRSQTIPTCHVAMRAQEWREMYGLIPGAIEESVRRSLDAWLPSRTAASPEPGMVVWMSDQQMMTEKLCAESWFPVMAKMIDRQGHPPYDRLDRQPSRAGNWDAPLDPRRWIDAHVFKAPWEPSSWTRLLRVIDAFLPQHSAWAREYHKEYMK